MVLAQHVHTQAKSKEKISTIALRITDKEMMRRIEELSNENGLSLNMTVNMLLGFAFNEVEKQNKRFESKIVFESK